MLFHYYLASTALLGHVALWTWLYNRLHASRLPSRHVQRLEKWVILAMGASAFALAYALFWPGERAPFVRGAGALGLWCVPCWMMLAYVVACWAARRITGRHVPGLITNDTTRLDFSADPNRWLGDRTTRWLQRIPGNQILDVHVHHKHLSLPGLPTPLEGLRIAQLSDLHMTGQLKRAFFDAVVDRTNAWDPDLVAITGDLVDAEDCITWIPQTLGRLQSRDGVFGILGNHDQRLVDVDRVRQALVDGGIIDLGGRSSVRSVRGVDVLLVGNEYPWFPRPDEDAVCRREQVAYAILLSHSPDELPWARERKFDLMLAGHTHGGQIRFPVVGPVVCPSRFGVRYASGLFEEPPTLLHVSRGLSGVHPLRWRCPPELTLLELHRRP